MRTILLKHGDILVIDPCYIKSITQSSGESRFDGLKLVKEFEVDDGLHEIFIKGKPIASIGVDSGRIWVLKAEFNVAVESDSGCSGELAVESNGVNCSACDFQVDKKLLPRANIIKDLEDFAKNYSDSAIESVGAFDEDGNARQEIMLTLEGKPYIITLGRVKE